MEVPLPGAEITILGDSLSALTDTAGRFVLRGIRPAQHIVRVRRVGFQAQYFVATLTPGEKKDVTIVMPPGVYELPELSVTARNAKPIEYAWTHKYDDFFQRQRVGLGHYLTRKDLDKKAATHTVEFLLGVPGLSVRLGAPGQVPDAVSVVGCRRVSVWVDGWELPSERFSYPMMGDPRTPAEMTGTLLDRIHPLQIEMIEVYTGPSQLPPEAVGNSCAAIMIWTR